MGEKYITLDEVCQMLSISKATGRNWLRLGKIESQRAMTDGKVYFTEDYVIELQRSLKTGKRNALRSRRNKGYVSGKGFYDRYVSEDCESTDVVKKLAGMLAEQNICVTETAMRALLSDCALKLLVDIPETNEILREYIDGRLDVGVWSILLDDIIQDKKEIETWIVSMMICWISAISFKRERMFSVCYTCLSGISVYGKLQDHILRQQKSSGI